MRHVTGAAAQPAHDRAACSSEPHDLALSVVVPAFDEAPNLARLADEVRDALDGAGLAWELIIVDDGSRDDTPRVLAQLAADDPRVRCVRLAARSGQSAALIAGFRAAVAPLIATLDADLQCPPRELPALIATLGGADLACGVRADRHDPWRRRVVSGFTNGLRRCVLAPRLRDLACPLRVFRRDALAEVEAIGPLFDGSHRWLPALFSLAGLRVVQRRVTHQARRAGTSKYTATGRAGPIAREIGRVFPIALQRSRALRVVLASIAIAVLTASFVYRIGAWPLTEPDEGRNAEVAREMLELHRWSVPHFDYLPYLDKPVLFFWLVAAADRVIGTGEVAARLPSALAGVATVVLTFVMTRALAGTRRGIIAAAALATMPLVFVFARAAIFDLLLTATVTGALLALVQGRRTGDAWRWWPIAGVCIGLAVLSKGPVGVAIPLVAWLAGRSALPAAPRRPPRAALLVSIGAAAVVVVPWLLAVHHDQPGFLRYALVDETFHRFTSVNGVHRGGPPYFYAGVLAWAGGVWTVVLAALAAPLARRWRSGDRDAPAIAFAVRAACAIVVFFSLSASKRPQYVLPALVPLAMLIGIGADLEARRCARVIRTLALVALPAGIVAIVVGWIGSFGTTQGPLRVVSPALVATAGLVLVVWGIAAIVLARRPVGALVSAALFMPMLGLMLLAPLRTYAESRSAKAIADHVPAGAPVVCLRTFLTGLPFYLQRPVLLLSPDGHELTSNYVLATRDRITDNASLGSVDDLPEILRRDPRTIVMSTRSPQQVEQLAQHHLVPLFTHHRTTLYRVSD